MTCDHQWQESGTSKKHDWVCSKCKILYTVLKGLDDDDIQTYVRPWVTLTEEEIWGAVSRIGTSDSDVNPYQTIKDARAIEALLRKKNT
jgi:hypothetical protein